MIEHGLEAAGKLYAGTRIEGVGTDFEIDDAITVHMGDQRGSKPLRVPGRGHLRTGFRRNRARKGKTRKHGGGRGNNSIEGNFVRDEIEFGRGLNNFCNAESSVISRRMALEQETCVERNIVQPAKAAQRPDGAFP